jgi:toxin CcdB
LPFRYFLNRRTTVIAPLVKAGLLAPIPRLNPQFRIADNDVALSPLEIVNIPTVELQTLVANLDSERQTIIAALDLLLTGV